MYWFKRTHSLAALQRSMSRTEKSTTRWPKNGPGDSRHDEDNDISSYLCSICMIYYFVKARYKINNNNILIIISHSLWLTSASCNSVKFVFLLHILALHWNLDILDLWGPRWMLKIVVWVSRQWGGNYDYLVNFPLLPLG